MRRPSSFLFACVVANTVIGAPAAMAQPTDSVRIQHWQADLAYLATELPRLHIQPWTHVSAREFEREVARLDADIPRLRDADIQLRLVRLVAMLRDGHSSATFPVYATRLPVSVYWFEDGPHIVSTSAEHTALLGARITRVAGRDVSAVRDSLVQYFSHENEMGARNGLPAVFSRPAVLRAVGVAPDSSAVELEVEQADGQRRSVTLAAVPVAGYTPAPRRDSLPLYLQKPRERYWFAWLPESRTVFLKYNQCRDADDFRALTDSVSRLIDSTGARRLVVDIRNNGGGDSRVLQPLVAAVRGRDGINRPNALYVITGRQTFSSGLLAAWQFRHDTRATIIGEPPGERTDNFGEVKKLTLPHSGLSVSYSTKHFKLGGKSDAFEPDVAVPPTAAALLSGRDDALEWILRDGRK